MLCLQSSLTGRHQVLELIFQYVPCHLRKLCFVPIFLTLHPASKIQALCSSTGYGDELVWAAIWLHKATFKQSYLDDAIAKYDEFKLASVDTTKGVTYDNKILAIQVFFQFERCVKDIFCTVCDVTESKSIAAYFKERTNQGCQFGFF